MFIYNKKMPMALTFAVRISQTGHRLFNNHMRWSYISHTPPPPPLASSDIEALSFIGKFHDAVARDKNLILEISVIKC